MRQSGVDRTHRSDDVDIDHARHRFDVGNGNRADVCDAGVGDHAIDATEPLHRPCHGRVQRVLIGDIGRPPRGRRPEVGGECGQSLRLQPHQGHLRTRLHHAPRDRFTNAARRSGDQNDLVTHRRSVLFAQAFRTTSHSGNDSRNPAPNADDGV